MIEKNILGQLFLIMIIIVSVNGSYKSCEETQPTKDIRMTVLMKELQKEKSAVI